MSFPLNCLSGLNNDAFAGWYPDSKGRKCTNFCFWSQASNLTNVPSPHQTTKLSDGSRWGCLIGASGDEVTLDSAMDRYEEFVGEHFPYLRCSHGANESLSSAFQRIVSSAGLWWGLLFGSICLLLLQAGIIWWKHRVRKIQFQERSSQPTSEHREVVDEKSIHDSIERNYSISIGRSLITGVIDADNIIDAHDSFHPNTESSEQSNKVNVLRWIVVALLIFLNIMLLFIIFVCTLSLLEIQQGLDLPFSLKILTPACTDPGQTCPQGLQNIDRASNDIPNDDLVAFSYMISSDSQLDWYDGESAFLGQQNYPTVCSESDSCESCTAKAAEYTNEQMKRSFEKLIRGEVEVEGPAPKGLVLNGDLTQYFHRSEKIKYKRIYHEIEGLQEFFPSLGNHDYDQGHATYNGDAWYQGFCNGIHGIAYIRGAFCGKVKSFDAKRRLTRYHSDSLAYSWEEGRYHFVHVHYYPTYENAALGIRSSIDWLENDLKRASEKNYTNILFIHSVADLSNQIAAEILLVNNVAVIFAGHLHRCFGRKCALLRTLDTQEVMNHLNGEKNIESTRIEKCFPASAALCNTRANGNGLFYLDDKASHLVLPPRKLTVPPIQTNGICPFSRFNVFVNETDNTAICGEIVVENAFPTSDYQKHGNRSIPIVWSGSSSFETFLKVDFHPDKIVINALSATEGNEGKRYADVFSLPNAVYPFHNKSDLDEFVITL
jgi:hypothetical protein